MELITCDNNIEGGKLAAELIIQHIQHGAKAIGLATGSTPLSTYNALIAQYHAGNIRFSQLYAFLLDEYIGLPAGHEQSYLQVIQEVFTSQVDFKSENIFSPYTPGQALPSAGKVYETTIADKGPIAVQILGIGGNGHIGFNEPGSSLTSRTRVKTLTEKTRSDNARFFASLAEVPVHVMTQGLGTISAAQHLILLAYGSAKSAAVHAAIEGPVSASCPASILQLHPRATVIVDRAAARRLNNLEYYNYCYTHKPDWQK